MTQLLLCLRQAVNLLEFRKYLEHNTILRMTYYRLIIIVGFRPKSKTKTTTTTIECCELILNDHGLMMAFISWGALLNSKNTFTITRLKIRRTVGSGQTRTLRTQISFNGSFFNSLESVARCPISSHRRSRWLADSCRKFCWRMSKRLIHEPWIHVHMLMRDWAQFFW